MPVIYNIRNKINGDIYIGSACGFKERERIHNYYLMKKLLFILFVFVSIPCFSQADTTYLKGQFFLTNWLHKNKLKITINRWQIIDPVRIKGLLYMIPNQVYIENKALVESRINLNRCVIRRVKKSELIKPKE